MVSRFLLATLFQPSVKACFLLTAREGGGGAFERVPYVREIGIPHPPGISAFPPQAVVTPPIAGLPFLARTGHQKEQR